MRITLAQLEALVWVSRLGSVGAAATQLNLTQPTVSLRLRDLSDAVGKPMFRKLGRQLVLTPDGQSVLDHAALIIEQVEKLYDRARPEKISGLVRIGVSEAVAMAGLPSIIDIARTRHPSLGIEMTVGTSGDLENDLLKSRIDLAIGINLHDDPRLRMIALGIQGATWVAKAGLELPKKVTPHDLYHLPILSNPSPSPMYQQTVNWFRSEGLSPRQVSVSNSITIIAHLVAAGIGVAILPTRLVEAAILAGRVTSLNSYPRIDDSRMSAAYRTDDWRPTINAMLEISREVIDGLNWLEPPAGTP